MLSEAFVIISSSRAPYHNQALEEFLLDQVKENSIILYLWQNERTVVIGKNQNAYNECNIEALEGDSGHLARRLSGGGAVYHDDGNLNFTFLTHRNDYDVEKQNEVILEALKDLGIAAERNGRNDLLIDGRKFSGHAYYKRKDRCFHHGTLMLNVDANDLSRYLHVSLLKLQDKGVDSVRSRVINLRQIKENLTIEQLQNSLIKALGKIYGLPVRELKEESLDPEKIASLEQGFADDAWRYGNRKEHAYKKEARFPWGTVQLYYDLQDDTIIDPEIYTDSLDIESIEALLKTLPGNRIADLVGKDQIQKDIISLLSEVE